MAMTTASKRHSSPLLSRRSAAHVASFIIFLALATFFVTQFNTAQHFPIRSVKIVGARHLEHTVVQRELTPLVQRGFFSVQVDAIKEKLLQSPWISTVNVRRIWPDQVWITIAEKNAIARWNENSLLSLSGDLFDPDETTVPTQLPDFYGPDGKQLYVMQYYKKISSLLEPLHFRITRMELTPSRFWNITLDNGIKLTIDHKDFLTRFGHFVKVYPKIIGDRADAVDYIDLRYANGMAVKWKSVT